MARDKTVEPAELVDAESLPVLTEKQFEFVRGIVAEGLSATAAYRQAYDCANMANETIWANASRLFHDSKIVAWVEASRLALLHGGEYTVERHVAELEALRREARAAGNYGASVKATELQGKAMGLYVERVRNEGPSDADLLAHLRALGVSESEVRKVADRLGLTLDVAVEGVPAEDGSEGDA